MTMLQSHAAYHALIDAVLRRLRIPPPLVPPGQRHDVYSLNVAGHTDIHLLNAQEDQLDIVAEVGTLDNCNAPATLLALLEMNRFSETHPPAGISVDRETGLVLCWMQHSLASLDANRLLGLVQAALDITGTVRHQLALSQADPRKMRMRDGTSTLLKGRVAPAAILNARRLPFAR